jgi:hypothetical protein
MRGFVHLMEIMMMPPTGAGRGFPGQFIEQRLVQKARPDH